jgi:hypothetical protein
MVVISLKAKLFEKLDPFLRVPTKKWYNYNSKLL